MELIVGFEMHFGAGAFFEPEVVRTKRSSIAADDRQLFARKGTIRDDVEHARRVSGRGAAETITTSLFAGEDRRGRIRAFIAAFAKEAHAVAEPMLESAVARDVIRRLRGSVGTLLSVPGWHGNARRVFPWAIDWRDLAKALDRVCSIDDLLAIVAEVAREADAHYALYVLQERADPARARDLTLQAIEALRRALAQARAGQRRSAVDQARTAIIHLERSILVDD